MEQISRKSWENAQLQYNFLNRVKFFRTLSDFKIKTESFICINAKWNRFFVLNAPIKFKMHMNKRQNFKLIIKN
jgi:hypothetical protein